MLVNLKHITIALVVITHKAHGAIVSCFTFKTFWKITLCDGTNLFKLW